MLLEEGDLTQHSFAQTITELLRDDEQRMRIAQRARELGKVHRQCTIVQEIERVAKAKRR